MSKKVHNVTHMPLPCGLALGTFKPMVQIRTDLDWFTVEVADCSYQEKWHRNGLVSFHDNYGRQTPPPLVGFRLEGYCRFKEQKPEQFFIDEEADRLTILAEDCPYAITDYRNGLVAFHKVGGDTIVGFQVSDFSQLKHYEDDWSVQST